MEASRFPDIWNNSMEDKTILTVIGMADGWTFTQEVTWPANTSLAKTLNDFQRYQLGSKRFCKILDFII